MIGKIGRGIRLGTLVLVLASGCARLPEESVQRKFQLAQQTFEQASSAEDFLRAAGLYQEILDEGLVSAVVLFNQGNAFVRAGQRGRAVACYRRALRYRPRDPNLHFNLQYALSDGAAQPTARPVVEYVLFWQDWLGYGEKMYCMMAAASASFLLGILAVIRRHKWARRSALAAGVFTAVCLVSAAYDWYRFDHVRHAVIVRDGVVARKGDGESYQPAFTEPLTETTEARVVDSRGQWLLLQFGDSQQGWVPRDAAQQF